MFDYAGSLGVDAFMELILEMPGGMAGLLLWLQRRPQHAQLLQDLQDIMDCRLDPESTRTVSCHLRLFIRSISFSDCLSQTWLHACAHDNMHSEPSSQMHLLSKHRLGELPLMLLSPSPASAGLPKTRVCMCT